MSRNYRQPEVGRRLHRLRKAAGLTRAQLAALTGVSTSAIARLEGGTDVRVSTYFPIAAYFVSHDARIWAIAEQVLLEREGGGGHD